MEVCALRVLLVIIIIIIIIFISDVMSPGDAQPVTVAAADSQLVDSASHNRPSASAAEPLSLATALGSVAMTVGFVYRSAFSPTTQPVPQQRCSVAHDGSNHRCICLGSRVGLSSGNCC